MRDRLKYQIPILAVLVLALVGMTRCAHSGGLPQSPSEQVMAYVNAGTVAADTAMHALVPLCNLQPGQVKQTVDPVTCQAVRDDILKFKPVFLGIAAEANSSDPWSTQRVKIAEIVAAAALDMTVKDPNVKPTYDAIVVQLNKILGVQ